MSTAADDINKALNKLGNNLLKAALKEAEVSTAPKATKAQLVAAYVDAVSHRGADNLVKRLTSPNVQAVKEALKCTTDDIAAFIKEKGVDYLLSNSPDDLLETFRTKLGLDETSSKDILKKLIADEILLIGSKDFLSSNIRVAVLTYLLIRLNCLHVKGSL
jgi:uncharacterized protein (DUF362 family)